jgi:hypothetical protein
MRARKAVERCIAEHCKQPPDCESACRAKSEWVFSACLERGHSEEECSALAQEFFGYCLSKNCG